MKLYIIEENAFIEVGEAVDGASYLVCIGTKTEALEAEPNQLMEMIRHAITLSKYNSVECTKQVH